MLNVEEMNKGYDTMLLEHYGSQDAVDAHKHRIANLTDVQRCNLADKISEELILRTRG